ncbi:MAG TPA: Spy/CpxP family protein refolding chaperone [Verrucomicrobiae bacterium]|nr:Spy/CpxP family protein refolding chaperone [Verrucomicrobiae bacterium]
MNRPLIRLAMAGALATGLALAQTSTPQTPATQANPAPTRAQRARPFRRTMRQRFMQELALSPAQQQQARQIFQQVRTANQPLRAQLRQNRQSLAAAVKADNTTQISQLTQARATLMAKMMATRADAMAKFYSTLTPEQKAKADQIHQRMEQRRSQMRTNG